MDMFGKIIVAQVEQADVVINGNRPFDIQVKNERLYRRVVLDGELGFGEAYVQGWWESDDIAELIKRLLLANVDKGQANLSGHLLSLSQKLRNPQSSKRASKNVEHHYDIGNDLYRVMLDPRMVYTCGYWKNAKNLAQAQEDKLDLVCRKLRLQKGQRVLDIGCGWGSFAKFAAERYGVEVIGITLSPEQIALGKELCAGLPIELLLMDYRDLPKHFADTPFDHIVSLGMFEHVGPKNYRTYMEAARAVLKPEGLFLLHSIGGDQGGTNAWINKYIFPGGWIPSAVAIDKAYKNIFVEEDKHNFGADYDKTLCAWNRRFEFGWPELQATGNYDEAFRRKQRYYLLSCAGMFRARKTQLWQFVLSPNGTPGGYERVS